ncbi:endolytic transglycosylase MltG [Arthrobacter sp. D1-17]
MSPVNSDDSSGRNFRGAGRALTRKEIRAREKSLTADSGNLVPEQAYESGNDGPDVPERLPTAQATTGAPTTGVPMVPTAPPTIAVPAAEHGDGHSGEHGMHAAGAPGTPAVEAHTDRLHHAAHAEGRHEEHVFSSAETQHYGEPHHNAEPHHDGGHAGDGYTAYHHGAHPDDAHHHDLLHQDPHAGTYEDHEHYGHDSVGQQLLGTPEVVKPRPSKKVRRRRRIVALLLTLALFVTATVVGAQFLKPLLGDSRPSDYPGPGTGQVTVAVQPGEGPMSVAAKLEDAKVVANADTFVSALAASGGTLAPGEYDFKQEMKNSDAVAVLLNEGQSKVMYVALSAGLRINESLEAISEGSGIPVSQFKTLSDSPQQFGLPAKAKNLEGYLAPGEHRFPLGTTPKEILTQLVKITTEELNAQGVADPAKQYEVLTVASIVQAEGGQAEYKDVAGAIYNRLKPNNTETAGLIQSDATVTYGLGRKSFHITEEEKADKSNPYNTYAIQGLPVGPIGSPGKTAIDAAAQPNKNEYMYWVTINLDTKETKFSKTLAEHQRYVDQYNAWCEANPGRCV